MTLIRQPAPENTDEAFCKKVCRIAGEQGWTLDDMCNRFTGCSYAFQHKDGRRLSGGITSERQDALISACKALLPEIYLSL